MTKDVREIIDGKEIRYYRNCCQCGKVWDEDKQEWNTKYTGIILSLKVLGCMNKYCDKVTDTYCDDCHKKEMEKYK